MPHTTAAVCAALLLAAGPDPDRDATNAPARQFDFWCGSWSIENTRLLPTGEKRTGSATLAVRPILRNRAILEQAWEGAPGSDMADAFGMSLRWYDPSLERWVVILCWPGGDPIAAGFSRMEGAFIDVEGDLQCHLYPPSCFDGPGFEPSDDFTNRFIFSEATPHSLRWQLEVPWRGKVITAWDMRFERTADTIEADAPLELAAPPAACACPQPEARALDWLVGDWSRMRLADDTSDDPGVPADALTVRGSSAIRGCATLLSIGCDTDEERFAILAYVPRDGNWQAHSLDRRDRHAAWIGAWDANASTLTLTATEASHPDRIGQTLTLVRATNTMMSLTIRPSDPEAPPILSASFRR